VEKGVCQTRAGESLSSVAALEPSTVAMFEQQPSVATSQC
jgi:hypothetical protein